MTTTVDENKSAHPGLVLTVVCLTQLMVVLDVTVVNVALPSIRTSLGFAPADLPWVVNAYTITFGGLLLLGGRLADLIGQRKAALTGLILFALTSLAGGLAQNPGELIGARALQGVAGALLLPVSLTIITTTFPEGPARHRAVGIWGAVAGMGGAVGVLLGGVLTEWLDWRWVLFVNMPIAAVAVPLTLAAVRDVPRARPRLDLAGALLITAATTLLVYAVVRTDTHPWGSASTIGLLVAAAALALAFLAVESRVREPLVRLGLLATRTVAVSSAVVFLIALAQFGAFYFASLYLQNVLGYSPIQTGLSFVPFSLGTVVGSILGARISRERGPWWPVTVGLALAAVGVAWFGAISPGGSFVGDILGPSLVASGGLGACLVANTAAATAGIAAHEAGLASGILNASRQIGGSIGLAVLVTIAGGVTRHHSGSPAAALTAGYARGFVVSGSLLALAAVLAGTLLPRRHVAAPPVDAATA
ncbi:MAG: MFS transporter, partial [Nocardioides sp.]|uniref:MFS transporter n=1 Tax=Nocardioides sp. TaxID=35761 RepID=UPI0039E6EC1F